MFYITIAALGLLLANNLNNVPKVYSVDTPAAMISNKLGFKHAHYELHRRAHKDLVLRDPRYWTKSKFHADLVNEANGPKERRSPFNLQVTKQGNIGEPVPVVQFPRGKHM